MGKTDFQHDIAVADASGNEVGLTLTKPKGTPSYAEYLDPALASQFFTGDPTYGRLPPEKEIRLVSSDHRGGAGLQYAGFPDNLKRYHYGTNIDARFPNEVRVGPISHPIILAAYPGECQNEGFEDWTAGAPDHWTFTPSIASTITEETTTVHSGSSAAKITIPNGDGFTLTQTLSWNDNYQGKAVTFTGYGQVSNAGLTVTVTIDDGVDASTTTFNNTGSYVQWTVSRTLNVAATQLQVKFNYGGGAIGLQTIAYLDTLRLTAPYNGQVTDWAEFNGSWYMASGRNLWKANATHAAFTLVSFFPARITSLLSASSAGTDYLFICLGWADAYYYMIADETFTESNLTNNTMKFIISDGTTWRGSNTNSTIRDSTDPINGGVNWTDPKQMGDDAYDIVDMKFFNGLPYIRKSDNQVLYLDSSEAVTYLISGRENLAGTNTARMYVWRDDALLIPYGKQDLIHYDGTAMSHIAPSFYIHNASDFVGQVQAVTGDEHWLYVILDNSTKIEILATRQEEVDGATDWRWHPLAELTLTNCQSATITSLYMKRLWIGSDTGTEYVYWYSIPTTYGDPDADANLTYYNAGGLLYTPGFHANFRGDRKAWVKITLTQGHAYNTNIYWYVYYKKQDDSGWTGIGSFKGSPTTKVTTMFLPVDAASANPISEVMFFKFMGITNDTTKTPILLSYDVQAVWYPTERKIIACQVKVEDYVPQADGQLDDRLGSNVRTTLDAINSSNWPRAFYPPYWASATDTVYVKKLPLPSGTPQLQLVKLEKDDNPIWVYNLLLEKVALS